MHPKNLIAAVVLGVALAAGIVLALVTAGNSAAPRAATVLPSPVSLPEFRLVDDDGRAAGPEVFRGQWNLVFFGFTHCPDICPLTLEKLARARERLAQAGADPLPQIVLVSVDPERDTPERLSAYVDSFGPGTLGLTGEIDEIRRLTEALGVWFAKSGADASGVSGGDPAIYSVDHSAVVIVIGPDARYRAVFSAPHEIEDFVHDLPLLPAA